jgi:hypothetical protein
VTTYEARKHARKEAEMDTGAIASHDRRDTAERIAAAADLAKALMRDEPENFKQGYSFANAVNAACEVECLKMNSLWVAMVAEELHLRLVAG